MFYMYVSLAMIVLGLVGVVSNPPPYLTVLSLVAVAGGSCGVLVSQGVSFLALVLLLIYLGGMMVVFAYSIAFTVSLNSEGWGGGYILEWDVLWSSLLYIFSLCAILLLSVDWERSSFWVIGAIYCGCDILFGGGAVGVSLLYSLGGLLLSAGAWSLLLVLFVVLKLVHGASLGAIRVV